MINLEDYLVTMLLFADHPSAIEINEQLYAEACFGGINFNERNANA